jgi:glycine/D-amino acid oxidase-like deaminating enzyme
VTGPETFDAVVVGGGFYGARLAVMLRKTGRSVMLVEREPALLARASLRNQARVHNGYHYPRSLLTALRSRLNYERFLDEYADCVDRSFPHYYAIARGISKVTFAQFSEFCRRIGAPLVAAPAPVKRLFDPSRVAAVFDVQECAFDADKLRARVGRDLRDAGVDVALETEAVRLDGRGAGGSMTLLTQSRARESEIATKLVLNCTYSRLNRLLAESNAPIIPAEHELTEMALVQPPRELAGAAVTVMDGPFFSLMPYPSRGLFTLSHVRYTPHASWHERPGEPSVDGDARLASRESRFTHMIRDAQRYLPVMSGSRYVDSLWEVKTVMPRSEQDDSRPILLQRSTAHPNCFTVLGAKIDSVYDVEEALAESLGIAEPVTRRRAQSAPRGIAAQRGNESLISIVAPLELDVTAAAVEAFVSETVIALRSIVAHYEIVLVDDGLPTEIADRVRALLARHDFVRLLRLSRHFGEETAITAGLDLAIGDYVIVMLPNMDPPSLIPEFFERARGDSDIVYGVRLHRKTEPLWYRAGARAFYWYINSVVGAGIPENSTQFRCMTRQVVNAITQIKGPDQYLRLLTSYIGFRKEALPYAPINRTGQPTVRPKADAAHLARALIIDHTTHPLRVVLRMGMVAAALNAVWVIARPGAGGQALWSALGLFLLTMMIGTTGEYVGALARRMRDRPAYYVREEHTSSVLLREERKNVVDATRDIS